jgi:hypothetical protein
VSYLKAHGLVASGLGVSDLLELGEEAFLEARRLWAQDHLDVNATSGSGVAYGMLWLDVEGPNDWSTNHATNVAFIEVITHGPWAPCHSATPQLTWDDGPPPISLFRPSPAHHHP